MNIEKALVVDDSKVAHLTLRKLLTERSIEVDWVGSGEDAITYMEKQVPDIVFMDVMMPGMDGFETTAVITKNSSITPPPVIMCSANATDEDRQNAKESGATAFLSKPYTPEQMDEILSMVRELPKSAAAETVALMAEVAAASAAEIADTQTSATSESISPQVSAPSQPALATADLERIAESAAWSMADKVSRDVAAEVAKAEAEKVARAIAEHTARAMAEQAGRKAAKAAVQAAQEAAKKVAAEIARHSAAEAAKTSAEKAARRVGSEIGEDIAKKSMTRGLETIQDELTKTLEQEVAESVQDMFARTIAGQEFKQQLQQISKEVVLPGAKSAAREAANEAAEEGMAELVGIRKRVGLALVVSWIAILMAVGAVALSQLI